MRKARMKDQPSSPNGAGVTTDDFARRLRELAPPDTIIYDEGITNSPAISRAFATDRPGRYHQTRSCSLGTGFPGAIGLKLANPQNPVFGFSGDGGAMYTIQALWTAARHNINAKFVVCNNRSYRILQSNLQHYWEERQLRPHGLPTSFDLMHPSLNFEALARGHGVDGMRVETSGQIDVAIHAALSDDRPYLIELILSD
jgi:benzoylformate decarboxylase